VGHPDSLKAVKRGFATKETLASEAASPTGVFSTAPVTWASATWVSATCFSVTRAELEEAVGNDMGGCGCEGEGVGEVVLARGVRLVVKGAEATEPEASAEMGTVLPS